MSTINFQLAYDGEDVRGHTMDVQELAPALLSLGNLIRDANSLVNGDKAKVRVFVQSDFEHRCFNIHFEIVQSVLSHLSDFIKDDHVKTAEDLLIWLGLIGILPAGGVIGFLKWKRGREITSKTIISDVTHEGEVRVTTGDGSSVTINQNIYHLSQDRKIRESVAGVFAPLGKPGIDTVRFSSSPDEPVISYDRESAEAIIQSSGVTDPDKILLEPQKIIAHVRVHSPVFDPKADRWRFRYGEEKIYADISETTIARDAIRRGGVLINDTYKVRMEITEHETPQGQFRNSYKILEVLDFIPAPKQASLFDQEQPSGG